MITAYLRRLGVPVCPEAEEAELDRRRREGGHRLDCPVWLEDPDGIEACDCGGDR